MKKRVLILFMATVMLLGLVSCGKPDTPIAEDEIKWEVKEALDGNDRRLALYVTNNSEYTIKRVKMHFKQKDGLSDDDINKFYSDLKGIWKNNGFDESQIDQFKEQYGISMEGTARFSGDGLKPGGSFVENKNNFLHYFGGIVYVSMPEHYEYVEPDTMEIRYVGKNGENGKVNYDFVSGNYTNVADDKDNIEDQMDDDESMQME